MQVVMEKFKKWCELLSIKGIIDGIHIVTTKLIRAFANDYYYKTWSYNIIAQAIIDCNLNSLHMCMLVYLSWLMNLKKKRKKNQEYQWRNFASIVEINLVKNIQKILIKKSKQ